MAALKGALDEEQRFRLRQPAGGLQARVGGRRHAVLYEGDGRLAAPVLAGKPRDVLDRTRGGDDVEVAVLVERSRREPLADHVIFAGGRADTDGRPEISAIRIPARACSPLRLKAFVLVSVPRRRQ